MKKAMIILSMSVSALLLSGCGEGTGTETKEINKQTHNTSKYNRSKAIKADWTYYVDFDIGLAKNDTQMKAHFFKGLPDELVNFQIFIDMDSNAKTGFSGTNGWEVYGADYLIENGSIFKSKTNGHDWNWQYIGAYANWDVKNSAGQGTYEYLNMSKASLGVIDTLNSKQAKIMIEAYDSKWVGKYWTATGITADIKKGGIPPQGNVVTRAELDAMIANGEDYSQVDVSGIKDMSRLFFRKDVKFDITGWDVSHVENMNNMFASAKTFNQAIGGWDVSSVTNMEYMFASARSFNQPIGTWDVSHVTNMYGMFIGAGAFNKPIGTWDVSNVDDMGSMFNAATAFNQPIGTWNVGHVTNMSSMFQRAYKFNQPLDTWNVSNVEDMTFLFYKNSFDKPLASWDVSKVTDMSYMFSSNKKFNQPLGAWDVSHVKKHLYFNMDSSLSDNNLPNFK